LSTAQQTVALIELLAGVVFGSYGAFTPQAFLALLSQTGSFFGVLIVLIV